MLECPFYDIVSVALDKPQTGAIIQHMDNPKILSQIQALVELMQIGGVTESRVSDLTRLVNRLEIPYSNFSLNLTVESLSNTIERTNRSKRADRD